MVNIMNSRMRQFDTEGIFEQDQITTSICWRRLSSSSCYILLGRGRSYGHAISSFLSVLSNRVICAFVFMELEVQQRFGVYLYATVILNAI